MIKTKSHEVDKAAILECFSYMFACILKLIALVLAEGRMVYKAEVYEIVCKDDILRWQEFWDAFKASIHQASYVSVDRLNYLKSKLKGEALEAISGYQLSNEHYVVVVEVFGNQQLIIDAHYRNLSQITPATNQVSKLCQCYDAIERHLQSL